MDSMKSFLMMHMRTLKMLSMLDQVAKPIGQMQQPPAARVLQSQHREHSRQSQLQA
jgi:hypothetical protein